MLLSTYTEIMNIAVSSIAWTNEEEADVAALLRSMEVTRVELAPTKIWQDPTRATFDEIQRTIDWWSRFGIEIVAFQAMLSLRPDLKLFQDTVNRGDCGAYLSDFVKMAGQMGVGRMIFDSPANRQRGEVSERDAFEVATGFFSSIAEVASRNQVVFCIEPNPAQYGCDFITKASEASTLVNAVNNPGFALNLDTACMALAGDDIGKTIRSYKDVLQHFHVTSPMLEQVEQRPDVDHVAAAEALKAIGYDKTVSIEMRPGDVGANVTRVAKAVKFAQDTYGA